MGLSVKDVRSRGAADANVHTFRHKKLRIFQNLWCVHMDKGDNFSQVYAVIFYGRRRFLFVVHKRLRFSNKN